MNVSFENLNPSDVAKMIGIDKTTVQGWCRNGVINFIDVSEPGSKKARYQIAEDEADYLKRLVKKHGKRKALLFYDKNWNIKKEEKIIAMDNPVIEIASEPIVPETHEDINNLPVRQPVKTLDDDKILDNIIYLREVKERIENCKAELAQLENEYRELKQEIIETL